MDLSKLKDQAASAAEKRSYAKAAELYVQIADAEPEHPDWRQRAGEALRKDGHGAEAVAQFQLAAEGWAGTGHLFKAIAVCKLVLKIDPGHTAIQRMLAGLYAQRDTRPPPPPEFPPPVYPPPVTRVARDPVSILGSELINLDELVPLEVVPLATVFRSQKSGQFELVPPDEATPEILPSASAYEISLDDLVPLDRIDDQISLSGLFRDAQSPPVVPGLPKIPLFSSLSSDRLQRLIGKVEVRDVAGGTTLVKEGERGGSLFVVVSGTVRVLVGEREVARLSDGEFFGEQAILTDFPRTATVVSQTAAQLLELSRQTVSQLVAESPDVLRMLLRFFRDRLLERLLRSSALFSSLSPEDARALSERFVFLELEPKMRVVRQGERAPGLFLLLAGEVQVMMGLAKLATLGPGDVFGEMSLLTGAPAMGSIVTVTKCWALELPSKQFQEIMVSYPQVLAYVSELADRRAESNERIELL